MNNNPIVSVLMTCYNRERYINIAIESVLASTYTNFELIIVDDGSKDNTIGIAKKYEALDNRIKVYQNPKNLGDYPNRNYAASLAKGIYIKYVDSDDYIYPNGLEILVKGMEAFPEASFGLCTLDAYTMRPFPFMLYPKEAYEYHFFGPRLFHKGPLASIILKKAFDEAGGFDPGRMISDTDMWHRMALAYPVVLFPDGIVWQRRHQEQELSDEHKFILKREKIKWKYLKDPSCRLSDIQFNKIKKIQIKTYLSFILSGLLKFKFKQAIVYSKCLAFTIQEKRINNI